jgi:hypothetical protein
MAIFRTPISNFNRLDYFCLFAAASIVIVKGGAEFFFGFSALNSFFVLILAMLFVLAERYSKLESSEKKAEL